MFIELTEAAAQELKSQKLRPSDRIYLVYDVDGCGCAVSGVAGLWLTDEADDDGVPAKTNTEVPIGYLRRQEVFFEEKLRLDFPAGHRAFTLKSDNQIYSTNVKLTDRRGALAMLGDVPQ